MNPVAIIFLLVTAAAMMSLPRRWAPLPLLVGACYMTNAQSINIGPFHFTVLRILLLIGFIRSWQRKERLPGGFKGLDKLVLYWGVWLLFSCVFHRPFGDALVFRLGVFYSVLGIYFLIRIFCQSTEDLIQIIKITAFILVPVALEMINEVITSRNVFSFLGGLPLEVLVREGKLRAQGPFGHPILAGTVGALCMPLMIGLWRQHPLVGKIGLTASLMMVWASASSGPMMSAILGIVALVLWRWRRFIPKMRIAAVIVYILCDMYMTRPAYYLLEKIDLTGNSTGYHRAAIIDAGITHLNEWWLGGTDYTRHWMPYGVSWSEDHCDITNHYLYYGIDGGLPLMILFICMLWVGFRYMGESLRLRAQASFPEQFLLWSLGVVLFTHAGTMISVAYFDQSVMFLYLNLAVIVSMHANALTEACVIKSDASTV
jgi:hypothetical protein